MSENTVKTLSIVGLVTGIISVVLAFIPFAVYFGIACGIAAIVTSAIALNGIAKGAPVSKGLAVGGLVLGIVGFLISVPMCICTVVCQGIMANPEVLG